MCSLSIVSVILIVFSVIISIRSQNAFYSLNLSQINSNTQSTQAVLNTGSNKLNASLESPLLKKKIDIGNCECDMTYNICDLFCCCDTDCPQVTIISI